MKQRIVVSGVGIISALGIGKENTFKAVISECTGIAPIRNLETEHKEFLVGEVKFSNKELLQMIGLPIGCLHTRPFLLGVLAIKEALKGAEINQGPVVFINSTTVCGMDKTEQYYLDFCNNHQYDDYIKIHNCGSCSEMIASYIEEYVGIGFSQVQTISTACSSAANAILAGGMMLQSGKAEVVVAGGTECLTNFHLNGFNTLKILDEGLCKPFDAKRNGINLGEGAAYIVLETERHFCRRKEINALPMGTYLLSGFGNACDAYHQTASSPNGEGAYRAMRLALEEASLQPCQIDYINAHGTGTRNNDASESAAIQRLFNNKIPPISSTKAFTGHATSAAGAIEAVISLLALENNLIPINLNYKEKAEDVAFIPQQENHHPEKPLEHVLSNSFGFGGNDTSLVFSKM